MRASDGANGLVLGRLLSSMGCCGDHTAEVTLDTIELVIMRVVYDGDRGSDVSMLALSLCPRPDKLRGREAVGGCEKLKEKWAAAGFTYDRSRG